MTSRIESYRKRFLEDWFSFNTAGLFILICLIYYALLLIKRVFIIDSIAAFEVLNDTGYIWVFDIIYSIQYLSVPVFLTWKVTWTAFTLWVGSFMFGYRLHFNQLWKLVLFTEIWFFIPELFKILWFTLIQTDPTYFEYLAFYPFSIMNLVDFQAIPKQFHYPLKALNLFELTYWFLLMAGIYFLSWKRWKTSVYIVLSIYVPLFLSWLVFYFLVY